MNVLQSELAQLREENARLKELLRKHGIAYETTPSPIVPTQKPIPQLSLEEKVALFWSLFRGREDVFARRWYSPWSSFPLQFSISVKKQRFQLLRSFFTMYLSREPMLFDISASARLNVCKVLCVCLVKL